MAISYNLVFDMLKDFIQGGDFSEKNIKVLSDKLIKLQSYNLSNMIMAGILRLYKDDYEKLKVDVIKLALLDDYSQYSEGDRVKAIGVLLSGFNIKFDDFTQLLNEAQARIEYEEIKDANLPF